MSEAEWGKVYDLFDPTLKRTIPKASAAIALRACGRLLLKDQMDALLKRFPDPMTKPQFLEAMSETVSGEPKEKNLLTAFQAFDVKEQNDLSRLEVQQMLCTMNEKITKEEFETVTEGLKFTENDRVNIDDLFKWVTRPLRVMAHGAVVAPGAKPPAGGAAQPDPFA